MNQLLEIPIFLTSLFAKKVNADFVGIEKHIKSVQEKTKSVELSNSGGWQSPIFKSPYDSTLIEDLIETQISPSAHLIINNHIKHSTPFKHVEYWYNVNPPNTFNMPHSHPRSIFSGVVYIKVSPNCGNIIFYRSQNEITELGFINSPGSQTNLYNNTTFWMPPEQGTLIMFPNYTTHHVEQNKSDEDRISIAFNFCV